MLAPLSAIELRTVNGGFCLAPLPETMATIREIVAQYEALSDEAKESLKANFPLLFTLLGVMAPFW
ncbi:hypothetical protein LX66_3830 [Chitinophaga japonensis]|uniref:Uncharacterized protein n=2 Tax=Chitinophaga japonensis TaxID=104662 RepID=A0A562SZ57_CHIJA|nr:hypothetical protein LX66_3830 [Chitinophaga japonensis]